MYEEGLSCNSHTPHGRNKAARAFKNGLKGTTTKTEHVRRELIPELTHITSLYYCDIIIGCPESKVGGNRVPRTLTGLIDLVVDSAAYLVGANFGFLEITCS